ncbi:putative GTP diphosphokinase [Bacteriovorax sp. BSW11_IV]|uniref:RelA/SpoT family protein n=1 Tax=Bacteriovorax sp. BSW11_IV TaxID=1353529 RepID=UPI00038A08FF|nr:bifunctional (p)ppGpp synthetase/guanosine-3',5'-bis(diphosphate) 3'-pyrophosphohydrolase [Bacteriovorax sp. BSW11_IV]EQC49553.1 putative GTP diphosphokinase [Bacteriovorax sp. BSW11_IV]
MFQQLDFSHERNLTIDEVIKRVESYYPDADFALLRKAYYFAEKAHKGQMRSSGEEYIIHPLNVAATLVKLRMDIDSIAAGFLHDVVEDCDVTPEELEKEFNSEIAQIVVGLTKISKIKFKTKEESQAENFRKMVVAMAKDLRVIIVKLADRMHNMRTLQYVSDEKQKKIAQETLDIYVPLASRLGINSVKTELEDLCLRFLHPDIYYRLAEKIAMKKSDRETYIKQTIEIIEEKLLEYSMKAYVKGRPKHFFSIYKKMVARGVDFDQITDILAFRVIVSNITECYKGLGIIHSAFTPIPGRFKDYIAIPKVNNYQSLHTTVIGPQAERIEIQIRTQDMDEVAERGVAAHWKYKEGLVSGSKKLDWIQELLEFNQAVESNSEFMDVVKNDLDIGGVFVFTPKGDVQELRYGATPLDFAYAVHTEVGNHCVGAKVNGRMVPLRYTLKSGDTIEVLTSKTQNPSKDWMNIVKSSKAKSKIRQWLLKVERERNRELGEQMLDKALKVFSSSIKSTIKSGEMKQALKELKCRNEDELYQYIGSGKYTVQNVIEYIPTLKASQKEDELKKKIEEVDTLSKKLSKSARRKSNKDNAVIVDGMDDVLVRMARCCNPIPGDPILGFVTRGRGITVHKEDCARIELDMSRRIHVEWNPDFSFKHPVNVRIITHDKPGILSTISKAINNIGVNIRSALAKSLQDRKGSFVFEIEVKDYSELLKTISAIEAIEEVITVTRA